METTKEDLATRYLDATKSPGQIAEAQVQELQEQMAHMEGAQLSLEGRRKAKELVKTEVQATIDEIVRPILLDMDREHLEAAVEFYESDAGRALAEAQIAAHRELQTGITERLGEALPKLMKIMNQHKVSVN